MKEIIIGAVILVLFAAALIAIGGAVAREVLGGDMQDPE